MKSTRIYLVESTTSGPQAFGNEADALKRANTHMSEMQAWADITGRSGEFAENDVVNANTRSWSMHREGVNEPDGVRVTSLAVQ